MTQMPAQWQYGQQQRKQPKTTTTRNSTGKQVNLSFNLNGRAQSERFFL